MPHTKIKSYLDGLDQKKKILEYHLGEYKIAQEIGGILKKNKTYQPTKEDIAERIAFDFMPDYSDNDSGWQTYYGPMSILPDDKGQMIENPSIKKVDKEILEYWKERARKSKNPVLSSRYADLVIDFSLKVLDKKANIDLFHIVIDSNIVICDKLLADDLDCKTKIKRALTLAIQINDKKRIQITKEAIIQLEENIAEDNSPGLWGFAFRWLILDNSKKVDITNKECNKLINDIEERLKRIEKNPWPAEHAVDLLAKYYASKNDEKNLMRVLGVLENTLKEDERLNSEELLIMHAYENIHSIYREYASRFPEAEKASKRLSQEIGQLDLDWNKSLKQISIDKEIKEKDIEDFLKIIFGDNMDDKLEIVIPRIIRRFLLKKDILENELNHMSKEYPLQFLTKENIISDSSFFIAKLGSLKEDYDNRLKRYASDNISFNSIFLSLAMDKFKKIFTREDFLMYFESSSFFRNENREYLNRAIFSYWDEDYLISSHLFIPLIESAVRKLVQDSGGTVLRRNDLNGYDYVSLNVLLENDQIFKNIFKTLGSDVLWYFRLILTDKLSMNLRNNFAHGINKKIFFRRDVADRLFHILILLSLLVIKEI